MMRWTIQIAGLLTGLLAGLSMLAAPAHAGQPPLPEATQQALRQVQPDPPPKALAANAHFVMSDERAHWVFHDSVQNLGGTLLGIGTDPNYLFAGWMRADLVLLVDFDQMVADVHQLYAIALRNAADGNAFVDWWAPKQAKAFAKLIEAEAPDAVTRKRWLSSYRQSAYKIHGKWLYVRKALKARGIASLLSDSAQFEHVKGLAQSKRIWVWRGDLTAQQTMTGLQAALKATGTQLNAFYITNAERYFDYTAQVRRNLRDLPYAPQAVILRTQGRPDKKDEIADHFYSYYVQPASDFVAWLDTKGTASAKQICQRRKETKVKGLFMLGAPPTAADTATGGHDKPAAKGRGGGGAKRPAASKPAAAPATPPPAPATPPATGSSPPPAAAPAPAKNP